MRKGYRIFSAMALAACFVLAAVPFARAEEGKARKVTFITHWSPQAQFAGYYVAKEKGFYKARGIDVDILPSGPNISASQALSDGTADYAVLWLSQALQNRSQGVNLVNIGQMMQKSGLMFVAKKSDGIRTPRDLDGKKVSLWDGGLRLQGEIFLKKYGLNVTKIRQAYTINLFLAGGVDAAMAMWYNEYHTIVGSGLDPEDLSVFFFKDHGINVPEDGIYTLEERHCADPALSKAFVEASLEGWRYAFDHPDEAVDIVLDRMRADGLPANREHQKWMLESVQQLMAADGGRPAMGRLSPDDYLAVSRMLRDNDLIANVTEFSSFYVPVAHDAET